MITTLTHFGFAVVSLAALSAAVVRWRDAFTKSAERFAWVLMVDLFVAAAFMVPAMRDLVNHVTGNPLTGVVIVNLGVFLYGVGANLLISAVERPPGLVVPKWRKMFVRTLILMGVVLLVSPLVLHHDLQPDDTLFQFYDPSWGGVVYWVLCHGVLAVSCARSIVMVRHLLETAAGPFRVGLKLMLFDVCLGLGLMLYYLYLAWSVATGRGYSRQSFELVNLTGYMTCILLVVVAGSYSVISVSVSRMLGSRTERRTVTRLEPLWMALSDAFPDIKADLPGGSELRLIRRVVEIRDGLLACREYAVDVNDAHNLANLVDAVEPSDRPAAVEVACVVLAVKAKTSGAPPADAHVALASVHDLDLQAEVGRLLAVADSYSLLSKRMTTVNHRQLRALISTGPEDGVGRGEPSPAA